MVRSDSLSVVLSEFARTMLTTGYIAAPAATAAQALADVAHRLAALVRTSDTLARVSGDEFVHLCEDLAGPFDIESLVRRIDEAFDTPDLAQGFLFAHPMSALDPAAQLA